MTDDMTVFELAEEGPHKDPLATALAQAAAWQARAERLEGALSRIAEGRFVKGDSGAIPEAIARQALSSPRPEPSVLLSLARPSLTMELALDALESKDLSIEEAREVVALGEEKLKKAEADLRAAVDNLTPEERAAILGEGS